MADVVIKHGHLFGKGVYAVRDFKKGEVVIQYNLKPLSQVEFAVLTEREKNFVHRHYGVLYLYGEPERYVNHSKNPNTRQDLRQKCDVALVDIKAGEAITTDASKDDID